MRFTPVKLRVMRYVVVQKCSTELFLSVFVDHFGQGCPPPPPPLPAPPPEAQAVCLLLDLAEPLLELAQCLIADGVCFSVVGIDPLFHSIHLGYVVHEHVFDAILES